MDTGQADQLLPGSDLPLARRRALVLQLRRAIRRAALVHLPGTELRGAHRPPRQHRPLGVPERQRLPRPHRRGQRQRCPRALATAVIPSSGPGLDGPGLHVASRGHRDRRGHLHGDPPLRQRPRGGLLVLRIRLPGRSRSGPGFGVLSVNGGAWRATGETVKFDLRHQPPVPAGPTVVSTPARLADTTVAAGYDTLVQVAGSTACPATGAIGVWVNVTVDHPTPTVSSSAYPGDGTSTVDNAFAYRDRGRAGLRRVGPARGGRDHPGGVERERPGWSSTSPDG